MPETLSVWTQVRWPVLQLGTPACARCHTLVSMADALDNAQIGVEIIANANGGRGAAAAAAGGGGTRRRSWRELLAM